MSRCLLHSHTLPLGPGVKTCSAVNRNAFPVRRDRTGRVAVACTSVIQHPAAANSTTSNALLRQEEDELESLLQQPVTLPRKDKWADSFCNTLRDYRALTDELRPWLTVFEASKGRKPRVADLAEAEHALEDSGLRDSLRRYLLLRQKLFSEIPQIRKVVNAATGQQGGRAGKNARRVGGKAVRPSLGSDVASKVSKVMEYQMKRADAKQMQSVSSQLHITAVQPQGTALDNPQILSAPATAASTPQSVAAAGQSSKAATSGDADTDSRVKSAMMKALEYKKRKVAVPTTAAAPPQASLVNAAVSGHGPAAPAVPRVLIGRFPQNEQRRLRSLDDPPSSPTPAVILASTTPGPSPSLGSTPAMHSTDRTAPAIFPADHAWLPNTVHAAPPAPLPISRPAAAQANHAAAPNTLDASHAAPLPISRPAAAQANHAAAPNTLDASHAAPLPISRPAPVQTDRAMPPAATATGPSLDKHMDPAGAYAQQDSAPCSTTPASISSITPSTNPGSISGITPSTAAQSLRSVLAVASGERRLSGRAVEAKPAAPLEQEPDLTGCTPHLSPA